MTDRKNLKLELDLMIKKILITFILKIKIKVIIKKNLMVLNKMNF